MYDSHCFATHNPDWLATLLGSCSLLVVVPSKTSGFQVEGSASQVLLFLKDPTLEVILLGKKCHGKEYTHCILMDTHQYHSLELKVVPSYKWLKLGLEVWNFLH